MAITDLTELNKYAATPFPVGTWKSLRTFYSPVDDVTGVINALLASTRVSLTLSMYAFTDVSHVEPLVAIFGNPAITSLMVLDKSQFTDDDESKILGSLATDPRTAIGNSEKDAIVHLKAGVIDHQDVFYGSTNWSVSGQTLQDNQLTVVRNSIEAARLETRITAIWNHIKSGTGGTEL